MKKQKNTRYTSRATLHVLVLGGSGAMGRGIVRELLASKKTNHVTVADAHIDFYKKNPPLWVRKNLQRLTWKKVDLLSEPQSLVRLLRDHFLLINATTHHLNLTAMKIALRARVHYLDLGGLYHATLKQLKFHRQFKARKRLAVLGMGCAPGLSNLLAIHAAKEMDRVNAIRIRVGGCTFERSGLPVGTIAVPYALGTIQEELSLKPQIFFGGKIKAVSPRSGKEKFKFPSPVGVQTVFHTLHSEIATLPDSFRNRGVREVSFKIGFEKKLINALLRRSKRTKFIVPSRVKDVEATCALVQGCKKGKPVQVIACAMARSRNGISAGTIDTMIPPAVVAQMFPEMNRSGVYPPERVVPIDQFLRAIQKRGIKIMRANVKC